MAMLSAFLAASVSASLIWILKDAKVCQNACGARCTCNDLQTEMGRHWTSHAFWIEAYAKAVLLGEDTAGVLEKLLSNKNEIGLIFEFHLGPDGGNAVSRLLKIHIDRTVSMLTSIIKRGRTNPSTSLSICAHWTSGDFLAQALADYAHVSCGHLLLRKHSEHLVALTVAALRKKDRQVIEELRNLYYNNIQKLSTVVCQGLLKCKKAVVQREDSSGCCCLKGLLQSKN